jgi:hypothetical protein
MTSIINKRLFEIVEQLAEKEIERDPSNFMKLESLINNWYFDTNDIDRTSPNKAETSMDSPHESSERKDELNHI